MDVVTAENMLEQLRSYTTEICKLYGIGRGCKRNSYGAFAPGQPTGAITHYTASNWTSTRIQNLLERLKPGSDQGAGVQFIIVDVTPPRHQSIKERYPLIAEIPAEIYYFGMETFWQAGWFNKMSYGVEIRNVGRIFHDVDGNPYWNNGKARFFGRAPIPVGKSFWEPYTKSQMIGCLLVHRIMATLYPIVPERFLGHTHVTSTRIDPGLHFPIHEMRHYALVDKTTELRKVPFLSEFNDGAVEDDCHVSEESLHKGLYRHDWDGKPGVDDDVREDPFRCWTEDDKATAYESFAENPRVWANAQNRLRMLGYCVDGPGKMPAELLESVRIFQARWKVKKGLRWVQRLRVTGKLDEETMRLISVMETEGGA